MFRVFFMILALTLSSFAMADELKFMPAKRSDPVRSAEIVNATQASIAKGKKLYQINCASCHGAEGKGDGAGGAALNPKPRNFASTSGWTNGIKFSDMYKTLEEGIAQNGMASFDNLDIRDRIAIIHYIQSLNSALPAPTNADYSRVNQKYGISKGQKFPGQVPVSIAMYQMVKEEDARTGRGASGSTLYHKFRCQMCHSTDKNGPEMLGPNLYDIGRRFTRDEILVSLLDPDKEVKEGYPEGLMADTLKGRNFHKISRHELNRLIDYVQSL